MLNQALSVFDFRKIKYPDHSQRWTLYIIPLLLSLLICAGLTYLAYIHEDPKYNFLLNEKFSDTFTFLSILPGFFIASLSAIGAISRDSIDKIINENNAPYLIKYEQDRGETYQQPLTRRIFLSMLFAYLSAISLVLAIFLIVIRFIYSLFPPSLIVYSIVIFIIFFIAVQITTLTFVGIGYLGYKALASN